MKKFFTKEVKIGVTFVLALAFLIYGINFLKGIDLFTPSNTYILVYDNLDGLVVSNGVYIKGYKVGQVKEIAYDFKKEHPFTVEILINKDIELPLGTIAYLYDESLLGGKGINLVFGEGNKYYAKGDTLTTDAQGGLLSSVGDIVPKLTETIDHIDSTVVSVNALLNSDEIKNSLKNVENVTAEAEKTMKQINYFMNVKFPPMVQNIDSVVNDVKGVTGQLSQSDIQGMMAKINGAMDNVNEITAKINSSEGTVGQLLTNKSIYDKIDGTIESANALIVDLKANPKRYVHFSLFGAKEKKQKTK